MKNKTILEAQKDLDTISKDEDIKEFIDKYPIESGAQGLIDQCMLTVSRHDNLSEDAQNLLATAFKLTYVYAIAHGREVSLEELREAIAAKKTSK